MCDKKHCCDDLDELFDSHFMMGKKTPLRKDAFELSDEAKIEKIKMHFEEILHTLGLDLTDDSIKGTPN